MTHTPLAYLAASVAALIIVIAATGPAAARIECRGNFQITKYGPIATPYCEEEQIASWREAMARTSRDTRSGMTRCSRSISARPSAMTTG